MQPSAAAGGNGASSGAGGGAVLGEAMAELCGLLRDPGGA
eukprot:gene35046-10732_t